MIRKLILTLFTVLYLLFTANHVFVDGVSKNKAAIVASNFISNTDYRLQVADCSFQIFEGDTVLYIFNLKSKGFVIVSADDNVYPILGYSFEGNWEQSLQMSASQLPEGLKDLIDTYNKQISATRKLKLRFNNEVAKNAWNELSATNYSQNKSSKGSTKTVGPLLISTWDQGAYYDEDCPADTMGPGGHAVVGCVALAMAQVMNYYRYPQHGTGQYGYYSYGYGYLSADFGNTTYDWNSMPNSINRHTPTLALLLYHCGVSVDMMYGATGSSSSTQNIAYALPTYFNYSDSIQYNDRFGYSDSEWKAMIWGNLDKRLPVIYGGSDPQQGGHCWVCDGYQDTAYFHMNWGWSGAYDGYFMLDNLNPSGFKFNDGQQSIINIFPPNTVYPIYCIGQKTLTADRGVFDDGSGQKNYLNNSDCTWLISPPDIKNITLTFDRFSTQLNKDIVTVYDGDTETSTVLATYSGKDTATRTVQSKGNKMLVRFKTDNNTTDEGWSASYSCTYPNYCSGMQTLTAPTDTFSNGSWGHYYGTSTNCQWFITPKNAKTITLHFLSFDTEKNKDIVKVIDPVNSPPKVLATYSGTNLPNDVTATNGQMLVIFTTTSTDMQHKGWLAQYFITTGVNSYEQSAINIQIYPNPATDKVNISCQLPVASSQLYDYQLSILNSLGQAVFNEQRAKNNEQLNINVEGFAKGVYTVRIVYNSEIICRKLVVN